MEQFWAWYDGKICLVSDQDLETGFCEVQILSKSGTKDYDRNIWILSEDRQVVSMSEIRDCDTHLIEEIAEGIFIIDNGDEDYCPSTESSSEDESVEYDSTESDDYEIN
tara:strand:+ start:1154 stop:1480 length:327 start_codon:yes stop_codon:yes gene_type:complete